MAIEDRRNPRLFLASPRNTEWGRIEINGCEVPCASVQDVSVSGAGITAALDLPPGSRVTLRLTAAQVDVAIRGSVIWHRRSGSGNDGEGSRAGIAFDPSDEENCYLFYGLVRSHAPSLDTVTG